MALPTVSDLKSYLRIETTAEDTLLTALIARAKAQMEVWTDVPVTAVNTTAVDRADTIDPQPCLSLIFPKRPIGTTATIVDSEGTTVPATDYTINQSSGVIYANAGYSFPYGPYTITTSCGLSLRGDYAQIEPVLSQCIIDLAADLYQKRTPNASTETAAGTSISWDVSRDTAARVLKVLRTFKLAVAG
jgi:hypothetical protein